MWLPFNPFVWYGYGNWLPWPYVGGLGPLVGFWQFFF